MWHISGDVAWQFVWQFVQAGQAGRVAGFLASKVCYMLFAVLLLAGWFWGFC